MRSRHFLLALLAFPATLAAQPRAADVADKDAIIAALYDVISGPAETPRDWSRFHHLMHPTARLQAVTGARTATGLRTFTPEEYATGTGAQLEQVGFREHEVGRHEIVAGRILHVASAYESTRERPQAGPAGRGVNSIQLLFDGTRWWILSILWDGSPDASATWPPSWMAARE